MKHCMVDLETTGTKPGCRVLSIGACIFDFDLPLESCITDQFYLNVDRQSSVAAGLTSTQSTLEWWKKQPKHIRDKLKENPVHINDAMQSFIAFYNRNQAERIWGNGASFDPPILEAVMNAVNIRAPWAFWDIRDVRTIIELGNVQLDKTKDLHDALQDAIRQVHACHKAYHNLIKPSSK